MGFKMKSAIIRIEIPEKFLNSAILALKPECESTPTERFKAEVSTSNSTLIIIIKALDTSSLRAALNAYLRWVKAVLDSCVVVEQLKEK